jgi:methyltransferase family protein
MPMRTGNVERMIRQLGEDDLVLDVGGWSQPFTRADWVIDLMPYDTRARQGSQGPLPERFTSETWVERDICDREPWPFQDGQFDFAVCGHTLEDVRDPIWVCSELIRVARAGYIEVPSRLEEHTFGFQGMWVGYGHHHWLIDISGDRIEFVLKHHVIHGPEANHFPLRFYKSLNEEQKAQWLWWEGSFEYGERIMLEPWELDPYLADFVAANRRSSPLRDGASKLLRLLADRIR